MIVQTLLCGFILFTGAFASNVDESTPKVFNLKDALEKFCKLFHDVYGVKVLWTDMNSNRTEMRNLFATKKFQVKVEMGPITIGEANTSSSTRTLLYANLYDNEANARVCT
uniref:Putative cytotoxin-like protein n=1 Tax=Ixodes ricinus TaxID=34613 RepID=A0A0K8RLP7_IXORI